MSSKYKTKIKPLDDGLQLAGSAADVLGKQMDSIRSELTGAQVKLRTNKRFKKIVVFVIFIAALVDILGTILVAPLMPSLCLLAEGAPFSQARLLEGYTCPSTGTPACAVEEKATYEMILQSPNVTAVLTPRAFKSVPFSFSKAIEIPMAIGQFMSGLGSLVVGNLVDKLGAKIPILICLSMGLVGYFLMYTAGMSSNSYWLFSIGLWVNNLFGVVSDIGATYVGQLFADNPTERDTYMGVVQGAGFLGATLGAFVIMPFVTGNGANAFYAIWLAIGLTIFAIFMSAFILVNPPKGEKTTEVVATPRQAQKLLIMVILASAFDSGGDVGTSMARSTILVGLHPHWGTPANNNILLTLIIALVIGSMVFLQILRKQTGLAVTATIGAVATLATQLALASNSWSEGAYLALWFSGKFFGFLSTFGSAFMIAQIAPKENLGFWNGLNGGLSNFVTGGSQILFSSVYDSFNTTPEGQRGMQTLYATSAVSAIAAIFYVALVPMWPKVEDDAKTKKKKDDDYSDFAKWEALPDKEWANLPMETVDNVNMKMLEAKKAPRMVSWGDYTEQRSSLYGLKERALVDFKYVTDTMRGMLADRDKMLNMQKMQNQMDEIMPKVDRDQAKAEMGAWIADYFDDAGYKDWEKMAPLYKAMLMNAFPPVDPLDDLKPDYATMSIDKFEDALMKFLEVMDSHLAIERKNEWAKLGSRIFLGSLRRR